MVAENGTATRTAIIAGCTGLIGTACLDIVLNEDRYAKVVALSRRPLHREHPRLENKVVDFDRLEESIKDIRLDDAYCCLGTTIKQAGSQEAFKKVDYEYVMRFARCAREAGAKRLMLVSAVGVSADSRIFYNRVKGEVERDVKQLGYPVLHIFRPSLLLGNRRDFRFGERVAAVLMKVLKPLLIGGWTRYRGISGLRVARAMRAAAFSAKEGVHTHEYRQMQELTGGR